jgi:hypothetical protein
VLIIVEGPDGSGKTTLVEKLREHLHRTVDTPQVLHARPPKDHPLNEYELPLFTYRPGVNDHVICDRWHWGESVYPAVLGRDTQFDLAVRRHVELFLLKKGAVVVHVRTPWRTAAARLAKRGDDSVHPSQVHRLFLEYDHVAQRTLLPVITMNGGDVMPGQLNFIIEAARAAEQQVWCLDAAVTYVGPRRPRALLLGDVRHELRDEESRARSTVNPLSPAFMPFPATSGHYLLSHVRTVRDLGLANACDVDDWRVLHSLLGRPKIVTLGQRAYQRVRRVKHGSTPHPQFVRRFHHRCGREYAAVIERAIEGEDLRTWRP